MGGNEPGARNICQVLKTGDSLRLKEPVELILEDGIRLRTDEKLLRGLPSGYHRMTSLRTGNQTHLIVSPGNCHLPKSMKSWGWAVQLYAMRSKKSWGMGDLNDLKTFSQWSAQRLGCDFVLANPLVAAIPITPQQASPYYPSSRLFLNPLYLRIEDVPGAGKIKKTLAPLVAAGRALNTDRAIDRDTVFRLKMDALRKIWREFPPLPDFEIFCQVQGKPLWEFATFCALAQYFKAGWHHWPVLFRSPHSAAVRRFAEEHEGQIRFHQWLQWLLDGQFQKAAAALPIIQDLPVGVDPGGADAWRWQNLLAKGMAIGAPPDAYNSDGQNWGMQPFIPQRLRESGYEPFRQTLRAMLRFGGGLRIDHVMGLFRLFWIPEPGAAKDGAYVHYRSDEFLAILAIESQRAKALIVGEDLGTVESSVRRELRRRKVLSYRLLWFESAPIKKFPRQALTAVTTHDLFTVAGIWNGSDLARQKKFGLHPNEKGMQDLAKKLSRRIHLPLSAEPAEAIERTYRLLAKAPSRLITATLDDALAVEERPNLPGSPASVPNWSVALPIPLEEIQKSALVQRVAQACKR
jgi:4-alpha-glucanotransferase